LIPSDRDLIEAVWDIAEGRNVAIRAALICENEKRATEISRRNTVLVRVASRIADYLPKNGPLASAAVRERERIGQAREMISKAGRCLDAAGIVHVFPKAFQHTPDMGHDIDLLVNAEAASTARALSTEFQLTAVHATVANRFAGKCEYDAAGRETPIEIHHRRLGHLGEHAPLAKQAMMARERISDGPLAAWQLAPPYQLVLSVLQRLYGHMLFRVSDVIAGAALIRCADADETHRLTEEAGIVRGLALFKDFVSGGVRTLDVVDGVYRVPKLGVVAPLFARTFTAFAISGRFGQAFRLAMIPPIAVSSRILGY